MWRYLQAAVLASPAIPGLGRFPLNLLGLGACAVLGFANPGFWFLGAGLEVAYLGWLLSSPSFRRWVDQGSAIARQAEDDPAALRRQLLDRLEPPLRAAQQEIDAAAARVIDILKGGGADEFTLIASRDALDRLAWTHLKLLVAQATLEAPDVVAGDPAAQAAALERDLADPTLAEPVRRSKQATLDILRRRIAVRAERGQHLAEIAADRERIAAQLALARENAAVAGRPLGISGEVELASGSLDFGAASGDIAQLDRTLQPARPTHA